MPLLCSQSEDDFTKVPAPVHLEEAELCLGWVNAFFSSCRFNYLARVHWLCAFWVMASLGRKDVVKLTEVVLWTAEWLQGLVSQVWFFLFPFLQNSPGTVFNSFCVFRKRPFKYWIHFHFPAGKLKHRSISSRFIQSWSNFEMLTGKIYLPWSIFYIKHSMKIFSWNSLSISKY